MLQPKQSMFVHQHLQSHALVTHPLHDTEFQKGHDAQRNCQPHHDHPLHHPLWRHVALVALFWHKIRRRVYLCRRQYLWRCTHQHHGQRASVSTRVAQFSASFLSNSAWGMLSMGSALYGGACAGMLQMGFHTLAHIALAGEFFYCLWYWSGDTSLLVAAWLGGMHCNAPFPPLSWIYSTWHGHPMVYTGRHKYVVAQGACTHWSAHKCVPRYTDHVLPKTTRENLCFLYTHKHPWCTNNHP